jgi:Ulp1 family protease
LYDSLFPHFSIPETLNPRYDFGAVSSWTNDIDVFDLDMIIIPINDNNIHWYSAFIYFRYTFPSCGRSVGFLFQVKEQRFKIYDSQRCPHKDVHEALKHHKP